MTTETIILVATKQRDYAKGRIDAAPDDAVVTIRESREARTQAQNRLLHRWFADIARHYGDRSAAEVKAECNLTYGRPIKDRDDKEWSAAFGFIFDQFNYETKLRAIRLLDVPFTRNMGVKQLNEYMGQMQRDYQGQGVHLTDPDAQKYERGM